MNVEQRLSKIKTVNDLDTQLRLAKQLMISQRTKSKQKGTLQQKLVFSKKEKEAEKVLRTLRRGYFDIEDAINRGGSASSAFSTRVIENV